MSRTWGRSSLRALGALLLLSSLGGCRTLTADADDFTRAEALDKLRGYYPEILEVSETAITVPNWIENRRKELVIPYEDIVEVRIVPQGKWFILWLIVGGIYSPLVYDLEVTLKNGWDVPIIHTCRGGLNLAPLWIYPNVLIHGYGPGHALDWLRQDSQARAKPAEPRK